METDKEGESLACNNLALEFVPGQAGPWESVDKALRR
jgi:hypothetical protein